MWFGVIVSKENTQRHCLETLAEHDVDDASMKSPIVCNVSSRNGDVVVAMLFL